MKNFNAGWLVGAALFAGSLPAHAQVQLFESDVSAIHPYLGVEWNSNITQPSVGFEYDIEGRTSLGFEASKPVSDTILIPGLNAYTMHPWLEFEFIEPGNLKVFSFAVRGDYIYEDVSKPDDNYNSFTRSRTGAGPVFALRYPTSPDMTVIPEVSYELFYVKWRTEYLNAPDPSTGGTQNLHYSDANVWHEFMGGVNLLYRINEVSSINFEPKVVLRLGPGTQSSDLFNLDAVFGYAYSF